MLILAFDHRSSFTEKLFGIKNRRLTAEEKKNIEEDVAEILNVKLEDPDKPVVLDIEAIRIMKPGHYELDLVRLFKNDPLIIKLEEGKYIIDLGQAFKKEEL